MDQQHARRLAILRRVKDLRRENPRLRREVAQRRAIKEYDEGPLEVNGSRRQPLQNSVAPVVAATHAEAASTPALETLPPLSEEIPVEDTFDDTDEDDPELKEPEPESVKAPFSREDLEKMGLDDLRALCKELKVSPARSREETVDRLIAKIS